jgi:hypothetical protein
MVQWGFFERLSVIQENDVCQPKNSFVDHLGHRKHAVEE